jgi:cobalamin biosynthesis protein CobT
MSAYYVQSFKDSFNKDVLNGATKANLLRLLRSIDLVGKSTHEESGNIDRKAFARFACGSTNIFSKREYKEADTSAVSILIDCSGSMSTDNRSHFAQDVAVQLVKTFDKAKVRNRVFGYDTPRRTQNENVRFYPFKHWNQSMQSAIPSLGYIHVSPQENSPDYSAIKLSLEDLRNQPERKKFLIILSDSESMHPEHMKYLDLLADKLGIKIIAIGIKSQETLKCFKHAIAVKDLSEMGGAVFNKFLSTLKGRK